MTYAKLATWTVVLGVLLLSAAGCADKQKQQIQALQQEKLGLERQVDELSAQLKQAQAERLDLVNQLDARNAELAALQARSQAGQPSGTAQGPGEWETGLTGDKVSLDTDILYASGKAELTSEGKRRLDKIVQDLKSTYAGMPVRVYGHTDNEPIHKTKALWQDNLDLSANRAMCVTRYLVSHGIAADRIETVAMGEHKPASSNATASGRANNRRVEIIVVKTASR